MLTSRNGSAGSPTMPNESLQSAPALRRIVPGQGAGKTGLSSGFQNSRRLMIISATESFVKESALASWQITYNPQNLWRPLL